MAKTKLLLINPEERGQIDDRRFIKAKIPAKERVKIHVADGANTCYRNGSVCLIREFKRFL